MPDGQQSPQPPFPPRVPGPFPPQYPMMPPGTQPPRKGSFLKNVFFYLLVIFLSVSAFYAISKPEEMREEKNITEVLEYVANDQVQRVEITGDILKIGLADGTKIQSRKESADSFLEILEKKEIDPAKIKEGIKVNDPALGTRWLDFFLNVSPVALMALLFFYIFRQARGAGSEIFSFGRSRARLFDGDGKSKIKFDSVAGAKEEKKELMEIVDFLKHPEKYNKLGARVPRGVLIVGPSGVGKTLLARAVAGEAGVPFFNMAGSEFMELLVGVGASRVRDLFQTAKTSAPSIIFIDEIDAIGRQRGFGIGGGHDEREQTLNQILVEMDGFDPRTRVIVVAATNRPDMLDPALVRPGRFDRRIVMQLPDIKEREEIIQLHMKGKPLTLGVSIEKLARRTVGFSGADIENMLNEAAILAARGEKIAIDPDDLEEAATKVKLGPERKRLQSEEEKKMTAYHEAGHAIVANNTPEMDPVHRVSIVARGLSLGFTMFPPKIDRQNETQTRILGMITAALGGRAAEEFIFKNLTVGAANDLQHATRLARMMVTEFGMSDLGPISLNYDNDKMWLARQLGEYTAYSDELLNKVDKEVERIIDQCYKEAKSILRKNRRALDAVAEALVKKETLDGEEFERIITKSSE